MWNLIFITYMSNGYAFSPSLLGNYESEAACAKVAEKIGAEVRRIQGAASFRWLCVDNAGRG